MMAMVLRLLLLAMYPLRSSTRRWKLMERFLHLNLSPDKARSVELACTASGKPLGAYYFWKVSQALQFMALRHLNEQSALQLISNLDVTDYDKFGAVTNSNRGCLLAIPHHGPFCFSIVALVERLRHKRPVLVFYNSPEEHASNGIFDDLYLRLYRDSSTGVTIAHNSRAGIAMASKHLKAGSFVVIMPDVYARQEDTYQLPFLGRSRNVMLGTASLARHCSASILPLSADLCGDGVRFRTRFGALIEPASSIARTRVGGQAWDLWSDYRTTLTMFRSLGELMREQLFQWQYCDSHYLSDLAPPSLRFEELTQLLDLLPKDPRVQVSSHSPIVVE